VFLGLCRAAQERLYANCKSVGLRLRRFESCTCHTVMSQDIRIALNLQGLVRGRRERGLAVDAIHVCRPA
jgi:hypothetical protein